MSNNTYNIFITNNRMYIMGIATIMILLFHIFQCYEANGLGRAPEFFRIMRYWGALGVDWFLFLSAYGLKCSYDKNSTFVFYRNRILRILPSYLPFLIIIYLIFLPEATIGVIVKEAISQISGFSLIKYADFFYAGFCFDWYTPAIMFLYITFPLFSYIAEKINKCPLYVQMACLLLISIAGVWITENKHFAMWLLAYRFSLFFLGILLYIKVRDGKKNENYILCLSFAFFGIFFDNNLFLISTLTPISFVIMSNANFNIPLKKSISYIGKYSYEIYIAQIIPVQFIYRTHITNDLYVLTIISIISTFSLGTLFAYCNHIFPRRIH